MRVDLRTLELFVAVAEEGSTTRAAQREHISQPAVSKQIAGLEQQLDVRLFERHHDGLRLTEAGEVFLRRARDLVADWSRAVSEVQEAVAAEGRRLRIGFVSTAANEFTQDILNRLARRRPDAEVQLCQLSCAAPAQEVRTGRVDVAIVRLPLTGAEDLRVVPLFQEQRWVALPETHRLVAQDEVAPREVMDEPFVRLPAEAGEWSAFWSGDDIRGERPARVAAVVSTPDEWLEAIACGFGVSFTPEANARYYRRPGVTYRAVRDLPPGEVAVATRRDLDSPLVEAFIASCMDVVGGQAAAPHPC